MIYTNQNPLNELIRNLSPDTSKLDQGWYLMNVSKTV
jgi:hypothetical protein